MSLKINMDQCPSADALIEQAQSVTGLTDLGDPAHNAGLEAFLSSLRHETWQSMTGRAREICVNFLIHHLTTRLRLVADRTAYPKIAEQPIERPLIVVGPPRSGSTLMHTLLSLDPDSMAPEHWMCREPSPPLAAGAPSDERMAKADAVMAELFELIPDIFITHPYMIEEGSGALAECGSDIMNMVCTSQQMWCFWGGDIYQRYLLEADHSAAVRFHHDFLQHAQYGHPGKHWALKGSDHMLWLEELAAQYPDAKLVWTHRDLAQQLGSLASVQSIILGLRGHPVTPEQRMAQGARAIELQHAAVEMALRTRDKIGEDRFIDISYHDMMADKVGTVRKIYDDCGRDLRDDHIANIDRWLADNQQTKHGKHKHSPDEFGFDRDAVNERFADYIARFGHGFDIRPEVAA